MADRAHLGARLPWAGSYESVASAEEFIWTTSLRRAAAPTPRPCFTTRGTALDVSSRAAKAMSASSPSALRPRAWWAPATSRVLRSGRRERSGAIKSSLPVASVATPAASPSSNPGLSSAMSCASRARRCEVLEGEPPASRVPGAHEHHPLVAHRPAHRRRGIHERGRHHLHPARRRTQRPGAVRREERCPLSRQLQRGRLRGRVAVVEALWRQATHLSEEDAPLGDQQSVRELMQRAASDRLTGIRLVGANRSVRPKPPGAPTGGDFSLKFAL